MNQSLVQIPRVLEWLVKFAQALTGFFTNAGQEFLDWAFDIIPLALVALTVLNAIVKLVGEERFDRFAKRLTKNSFTRYTVLPYCANFFVGSPSSFIFGRYLSEKHKPGYYEVCNRTNMIPMMCIFPHVNPGELFVWLGIYNGVVQRYGASSGALLAVATFLLGLVSSSFIGITVEKVANYIAKQQGKDWATIQMNKENMNN